MIREPILFRPFFSLLLLLSFSPFCTYEPTSQIHPKQTIVVTGGGEDALSILSDLLGQCGKIGSNLNQLARHFNSGGKDSEQIRAQLLTELSALTLFRLDAEKKMGELYGNHQAYKLEELRSYGT